MTSPIAAPIFRALPPMQRMRAPIGKDQVQLGQDERNELQQWKHRYQPQLGILQTPPLGPVDPQVSSAKAYVEQLVQELAGEELKKQGVQLRVELFSGDKPQAAVDDLNSQEKQWESKHPDQPWPIRSCNTSSRLAPTAKPLSITSIIALAANRQPALFPR